MKGVTGNEFQREKQTNYKKYTKRIAYCQVFISNMLLGLCILFAFVITLLTPSLVADKVPMELGMITQTGNFEKIPQEIRQGLILCVWFVIAFVGIGSTLQLMASFSLLSSTEIGVDPTKALENIRFWRYTTIVSILLEFCLFLFVSDFSVIVGLVIFLRVRSLLVVSGFAKILEKETLKKDGIEVAFLPQISVKQ